MKSPLILSVIAISLLMALPAFSEETNREGEISLMGLLANERGSKAKFNEYRDLNDGIYGRIKLLYDTDSYFVKFNAGDVGYATQSYSFESGLWDAAKLNLFYRELPHNITYGAVSPFTGVGTGSLTVPESVNVSNPASWPSVFDYSTDRKRYGGSISFNALKPFFVEVSALTEKRTGIKPAGIAADGEDGPAIELPEPIDYRTNMLKTDFGYIRKPLFLDLYFLYSDFYNRNDVLNFAGSAASDAGSLTLPPDNKYYNIGFRGALQLPFHSSLSVNTGWSRTTSEVQLLTEGTEGAVTSSSPGFNGKVITKNTSIALTTKPFRFFDGKFFYKDYSRDNQSTVIVESVQETEHVNVPFNYQKKQFGGSLGVRLPMNFYLRGEYARVDTDRSFTANTKDNNYKAELKWSGLDFITVRTGYERLVRSTQILPLPPSIPPDHATVAGAVNFNIAAKVRNSYKAEFDINPLDFLNIGVGYKYKNDAFREVLFGIKSDRRQEVFSNADLTIGQSAQLFVYSDYELVNFEQDQFNAGATWNSRVKEQYYDYGAGANIFLLPKKLTLNLRYDYARSNGNNDFTLSPAALASLEVPGANNTNVDIPNWDDYTKQSYVVKLIYNLTKKVTVSIGYTYEKFKYSDIQFDNYQLVVPDQFFGTGAFRDLSYKAGTIFASVSYRFW